MTISKNAFQVLERIEKGLCTDPESAVSEWIELPVDVDGRSVIALLNHVLDPIAGNDDGLNLLDKPTHNLLIELVESSPIKELIFHDESKKKMTINDNLTEEDIEEIRELIRKNRVAFGSAL